MTYEQLSPVGKYEHRKRIWDSTVKAVKKLHHYQVQHIMDVNEQEVIHQQAKKLLAISSKLLETARYLEEQVAGLAITLNDFADNLDTVKDSDDNHRPLLP